MVEIIVGLCGIVHHGADSHDRDIEYTEAGARNQKRYDDHIIDGLAALEFHHTPCNDVLIRIVLIASESMHDSVKHDHIESCEGRGVQKIHPRWRQGIEGTHIQNRAAVAQKGAGQKKDTSCGSAPFSEFLYRFVDMFFPDDLHNVGLAKIMPGGHAGEGNYNKQERQRNQQAPQIKGKKHVGTVDQNQPEESPDDPDKRESGKDACYG